MYFDHHKVDDALFSALRAHFTDDEVLELSWAIGEFISLGKIIRVLDVPYAEGPHAGAGARARPRE
jgi:alkylhydroperoxidase family enzyme